MYLSTWSCQHTCLLYFGCIYWQPEPPNDYLKETIHSSHFSVKNEGCVIKNSHSFFPQYFRQGRPLNQVILMVILTEKSKIKSIASRVRSNSFYWAFEDVDPRLLHISSDCTLRDEEPLVDIIRERSPIDCLFLEKIQHENATTGNIDRFRMHWPWVNPVKVAYPVMPSTSVHAIEKSILICVSAPQLFSVGSIIES